MAQTSRATRKALAQLEKLTVRPTGPVFPLYSRSRFGSGWRDNDGDGQNERAEALILWHRPGRSRVALEFATDRERRVVSGRWRCRFSGDWLRQASEIDIDHVVPLAEAWASGAHAWSPERRVRYANGFGIRSKRRSWLLPVTNSLNRSKGAKRPDQWMPPREEYAAHYAGLWIATKAYWGLSVCQAEKEALERILRGG